MKRRKPHPSTYPPSAHSKRKFYLHVPCAVWLIALAGCNERSESRQQIVKRWEPGQAMYDQRGLRRREYIVDGAQQTVFACTDSLTEAEVFKLGVVKVHREFGVYGLPLSDFEKGNFGLEAYSLIQVFDEEKC